MEKTLNANTFSQFYSPYLKPLDRYPNRNVLSASFVIAKLRITQLNQIKVFFLF